MHAPTREPVSTACVGSPVPAPGRGAGRFPGLDSLRFFAAGFVVIGHIPLNQAAVGLPHPSWGAMFFRGAPAVKLFFTLSGFLITYLLLQELTSTARIDVRRFYLRRICRIWPLYFAVAGIGLLVEQLVLPRLGYAGRHNYDWRLAALLYTLFLPNLMNSLAAVGGILNPLWSIGIEEQFYLVWAPAVRWQRHHLLRFIVAVMTGSFALFVAQWLGLFGDGHWKGFVDQLEFHYMAAGALAAWALQRAPERTLRSLPFRSSRAQLVFMALLIEYYFVGWIPWGAVGEELMQLVLYPWLIVNVAANPLRIVALDQPWTERLGAASYGIYMLHMPVLWGTSFLFLHASWWHASLVAYTAAYYAVALTGTVALAMASQRWFEAPFLRLKERLEVSPRESRTAATTGDDLERV